MPDNAIQYEMRFIYLPLPIVVYGWSVWENRAEMREQKSWKLKI